MKQTFYLSSALKFITILLPYCYFNALSSPKVSIMIPKTKFRAILFTSKKNEISKNNLKKSFSFKY